MVRPSPFEIHSDLEADTARIAVVGELDIATGPQLEQEARAMLARQPRELIIDLSRLTFIDSSGLRLFIALNDDASADGWALRLTRPPEAALTIFRITGAEENLPFVDDAPTL
jgi:anti-sigma B factor antagonist